MLTAQNRHATRAKTTESGREPPAKATPAGIDAAMAAPGAISVMLWNVTSRRPMAFRRRPAVVSLAVSVVIDVLQGRSRSMPGCSHGRHGSHQRISHWHRFRVPAVTMRPPAPPPGGRIGSCTQTGPSRASPTAARALARSMICGSGWPGYRPATHRPRGTGTGRGSPMAPECQPELATAPKLTGADRLRGQRSLTGLTGRRSLTGPTSPAAGLGQTRPGCADLTGLAGGRHAGGRTAGPPRPGRRTSAGPRPTGRGFAASRPGRGSAMILVTVRAERGRIQPLVGE